MPASDKHVLDYAGLQYFKTLLYNDLKTINGVVITGGGDLSLVVANTAITGATKCKITYDSKGLITGGTDLLASDIPSLAASKITSGTFNVARIPTLEISKISGLQAALDTKYEKPEGGIPADDLAESYILLSAKGSADGVASLDTNGQIPLSQLPDAILGASEQGGVVTYSSNDISISLNSNGAALLDTTAGTKTWAQLAAVLYANQVRGTGLYFIFDNNVDSYDFSINGASNIITDIQVGDWIIYNGGTEIRKISNVDAVKSVQIQGTASVISSSISTAQTGIVSTVLNLVAGHGDTVNPYSSKIANYILAAPNGSNGIPSFRALVSDDIPDLSDIYATINDVTVVIESDPSTWNTKTWNGLTDFDGTNIWTDGENIYYSNYSDQYVLDKSTSTWNVKTWNGFTNIYGANIWTDGENIYYSMGSSHWVLDKSTSTWNVKIWNGATKWVGNSSIDYQNIGGPYNITFISNNIEFVQIIYVNDWTGPHLEYVKSDNTKVTVYPQNSWTNAWTDEAYRTIQITGGVDAANPSLISWLNNNGSFSTDGIDIYGAAIWTDGENIYYSMGSSHWVLDKSTSTWNTKTWNGLTDFFGTNIWTDGENIYYSHYSNGLNNQYVLDKSTSTWNVKIWNGFTNIYGAAIWTDGENIYYSNYSDQYVLDKSTSTWNVKTWNGGTNFLGSNVWTDGENIYFSGGSYQYVLNNSTISEPVNEYVKTLAKKSDFTVSDTTLILEWL